MSYSITGLRTSVRNLINKNNTTTSSYNISTSLNKQVVQVLAKNRTPIGELEINYPTIWVELKSDREDFAQLGMTARRNLVIRFDIVAETAYGMAGSSGSAETEMIVLAQNLKTLFRSFPRLSSTAVVEKCTVIGTEYDTTQGVEDTWNSTARISLEIEKLVS